MTKRLLARGFQCLPIGLIGLYACGGTTSKQGGEADDHAAGKGGSASTGPNGNGSGATGGASAPGSTGSYGGVGIGGYAIGGAGSTGYPGGFPSYGCFEAGASIGTPSGSVAIEQLRVGDWVLAFDEQAGAVSPRRVTATFVHEVPTSGRLTLSDGRVLRVTGEHPIYDAELGQYVRADAFDGDETLITLTETQAPSSPGSTALDAPALGLAQTSGAGFVSQEQGPSVTVFNISVEGLENYFVEGVLVHNKSGTGNNCFATPPPWSAGECKSQSSCIHPSLTQGAHVELNQTTTPGAGGASGDNDAGSGGDSSEAAAGAGSGDDSSAPLSVALCPDAQLVGIPFLALDYRMPEDADGMPGFAIHTGEACGGTQLAEYWLVDSQPPSPGSVTTQCVYLPLSNVPPNLSVHSLHPQGEVSNLRFVASCDCARMPKMWTNCGLTGVSSCL
jgi:hypothetical protein